MLNKAKPTDPRLNQIQYFCEATSYERHYLCKDFSVEQNPTLKRNLILNWIQDQSGLFVHIGNLDNRPVNLDFLFVNLDGIWVAFWDCISQVADYEMIEKWFERNFKGVPQTNADNFHLILHFVHKE